MQSRQVSSTGSVSSSIEWLLQQQAGGTYADIQALLSHWEDLDDVRKLQYAQMAVLTRLVHMVLQGMSHLHKTSLS